MLDSVGIGAANDAAAFGDEGADTLGHIADRVEGLKIPNLQRLGLANLRNLHGVPAAPEPEGYFAWLREASNGKDTMTGARMASISHIISIITIPLMYMIFVG